MAALTQDDLKNALEAQASEFMKELRALQEQVSSPEASALRAKLKEEARLSQLARELATAVAGVEDRVFGDATSGSQKHRESKKRYAEHIVNEFAATEEVYQLKKVKKYLVADDGDLAAPAPPGREAAGADAAQAIVAVLSVAEIALLKTKIEQQIIVAAGTDPEVRKSVFAQLKSTAYADPVAVEAALAAGPRQTCHD